MDLDEVRGLSPEELSAALDDLRIEPGWEIGDSIRDATLLEPEGPTLPDPRDRRKEAFQNLIVGTIAERVFREEHLAALEPDGFEIADYHERGDNRDYGVSRDGLELPINVKVASTLFRNAQQVVGLAPDNCVPISAYKALGASERVPDLVYVDLVDFELRERVDRFMDELEGSLAIGWHLLSWYGGRGARAAENRYVDALFETHTEKLKRLAPGVTSFRVISAQRVLAIMRETPRRVPGLGVKGAGTGAFVAEVNVHIAVEEEMEPWDHVAESLRRNGIEPVLERIRRTVEAEVPDPQL